VGRLSQNDYKNVLHASCTTLGEDLLVRRLTIPDLVSDNINTLVELSDVQFTEAAMADTILKRQCRWCDQLEFDR
jgi:hypothetical protein